MRFAQRIQLPSDAPYGQILDSINGGLVSALAVRVGHTETAAMLNLSMSALMDPEVIENINASIRKSAERKK